MKNDDFCINNDEFGRSYVGWHQDTNYWGLRRIAHLMATLFLNFRLKMQKEWRTAPENDDFLLKTAPFYRAIGSGPPGHGVDRLF